MELLQFMVAPIVMCIVLVGIHVQLGLHVVRRGVIFVDIALAQSSAMGAAVGMVLGAEVGTPVSGLLGLAMALVVAGIIAGTRSYSNRVPQEAFIGMIYVVTAAATMLLLISHPHGSEEIETLLVGRILWVNWSTILQTGGLYAVLGGLLFLVGGKLQRISSDPYEARSAGMRVGLWDFLFYAILGIVVSRSVQIAGVLLVFSFLVAPAVMAMLLTKSRQLFLGWVLGVVIAGLGAVASYQWDLPTGATIVCAFGLSLGVVALGRRS